MKITPYIISFMLLISCVKKEKHSGFSNKTIESSKNLNEKKIHLRNFKKLTDTTKLFFIKILKTKKDTLVDYNYLSKEFVTSTEIKFNYPKLGHKTINDNNLILSNDTIEVKLTEIKFDPTKHKLIYQDTSKVSKKYRLLKIDEKKYYGSDGEMPKTEIESIKIKYKNKETELNTKSIKNLCNVGLSPKTTNVFIANNNRLILTFWASDGAGAYFTTLIIKNGKLEHKIIDFGF